MNLKFNRYSTLGVKPNASIPEIKKAYRRLAMEHHPDKNPNNRASEKKMLEINEAYEILSDEMEKKKYDADLMAYLKKEIEKEKKRETNSESRQYTNPSSSSFQRKSLEEKIVEAGKGVLETVLRVILKR